MSSKKTRPACTPEEKENQMISLAMSCAEQQMRDGTASSQVITHFLKLGTTRESLEKDTIVIKQGLLNAQKESIESGQHVEKLYSDALNAMKRYSGNSEVETEDD